MTASSSAVPTSNSQPDYLLGSLAGFLAALVVAPMRLALAYGTYDENFGFYRDFPFLSILAGVIVGVAVRFAAGNRRNPTLAMLAAGLTLLSLIINVLILYSYLNGQNPRTSLNAMQYIATGMPIIMQIECLWVIFALGIAFFLNFGMTSKGAQGSAVGLASGGGVSAAGDVVASPVEARHLGEPIRTYSTGVAGLTLPLALCGIGLSFGIIMIFVPSMQNIIVMALAFFPLAFGAWKLIQALTAPQEDVFIFEKGLALTKKGNTTTINWQDIEKLYEDHSTISYSGIPMYTKWDFTLVLQDGRKFVLDKRIKKFPELGEILHRKTGELAMAAATETFKHGGVVSFDALGISREGIHRDNQVTPWSQIRKVNVNNGIVMIHTYGKINLGVGTRMDRIANWRVFFKMTEQILSRVQRQTSQ